MSLDKTVINSAVDKKYTEFSAAIKTELQNKLSSHPTSVTYASEYDNIQTVKQKFAEINGQSEE